MVCYHPLTCIYPSVPREDGKRPLLFKPTQGMLVEKDSPIIRDLIDYEVINGFKIKVPCGKCIGCRLDYSRHWALRSMHEAKMHDKNCFVTLTFNDDHIPDDRSVHKEYIRSWLKRFRKKYGEGIRYMLCGEYGEKYQRPHYHILFYGFDFPDKYVYSERRGNIYYRSPGLEDIWREAYSSESNGFSIIGDVEFESSAYVARYVTKKVFGHKADKYYKGREPEFLLTSRMPGLGNEFFYKYYSDMFNLGYCLIDNKGRKFKAPIPRYYVNLMQEFNPNIYNLYKVDKLKYMYENMFKENLDETRERLDVREELKYMKLDKLIRFFDLDDFLHNI